MVRILLVDEHTLVRDCVERLLHGQPDLRVVGSFGEGNIAVRFAARELPDVAILDVGMPGAGAVDVARRVRAVSPRTRLLMLSMHDRSEHVQQARAAGAQGYVLKECAGDEVVAAVRAVHAGQRYLSRRISPPPEDPIDADPLDSLSAREREVLLLVVEGATSHQIAVQLGLSPKSIDTYRSRLMTKLNLEHLPALVKFAIRRGLTRA